MKKLLFSLAALALTTFSFAQKKAEDIAKFTTDVIDMGKIPQNIPATVTFVVKNISNEPLIIETASPTCGCTIGDYTKEPIAPGKEGKVVATYNAANLNTFEKHLNVKFAGVDQMTNITIKGEVLNAADYAKFKGTAAPATGTTVKSADTKTAPSTMVTKPAVKKKTVKTKAKTTNAVAKVSAN